MLFRPMDGQADFQSCCKAPDLCRVLPAAFDQAPEAMLLTSRTGQILRANAAYTRLTGWTVEECAGTWPDIDPPAEENNRRFLARLRTALRQFSKWTGEARFRSRDGHWLTVTLSVGQIVPDGEGAEICYLAIIADISDRKRLTEHFQRMAHFDALTGLPNRSLLRDRLGVAVASAQRSRRSGALLFLDLDRFKWVNDTLGHEAGDVLLRETARRLTACVRDSDTVARLGGDEFVIILSGLMQDSDAEMVARHILNALTQAYVLPGDNEVYVSGSIGIALFPANGDSYEHLMQYADTAMYQAKESGRNACRFYTPAMNEQALRRLKGETELRHALEKGEFELYFQPVISLETMNVVGAEALLRWNKPGEGVLTPASFLRMAEETGAITPIGNWVLSEAVNRLLDWRERGLAGLRLAVNLSSRQLRDDRMIGAARDQLIAAGADPGLLELEISEEILKSEDVYSLEALRRIIATGVSLTLDDFGQGYLSLQHLRRYPIRALKIDSVFVHNVTSGREDAAFTEALIALAHSLGIMIVAEGVETTGQCEFLRQRSCDFGQGYLFSQPLREADFLDYASGRLTPFIT